MGAKLVCPDKTVFNIMGDAVFGMVGMDFESASREKIPILTIAFNNSKLGGYKKVPPLVSKLFNFKYYFRKLF